MAARLPSLCAFSSESGVPHQPFHRALRVPLGLAHHIDNKRSSRGQHLLAVPMASGSGQWQRIGRVVRTSGEERHLHREASSYLVRSILESKGFRLPGAARN